MGVVNLNVEENIRFDAGQLTQLYRSLGEVGAENLLCDAMEELAIQLVRAEKLGKRGRLSDVAEIADNLVPIASRVGLEGLSTVLEDLAKCARDYDVAAFNAVLARMQRMGDRSLSAIWDPQGMTV
ncbi:MAG: hypothetical protein ACPGNV_04135 [Mangrovicoccus sp.]